jgi:hypothetical protein
MAVTDKIDNNKGFFTRRYFRHVSENVFFVPVYSESLLINCYNMCN